jgi:hypothetical protein
MRQLLTAVPVYSKDGRDRSGHSPRVELLARQTGAGPESTRLRPFVSAVAEVENKRKQADRPNSIRRETFSKVRRQTEYLSVISCIKKQISHNINISLDLLPQNHLQIAILIFM